MLERETEEHVTIELMKKHDCTPTSTNNNGEQ